MYYCKVNICTRMYILYSGYSYEYVHKVHSQDSCVDIKYKYVHAVHSQDQLCGLYTNMYIRYTARTVCILRTSMYFLYTARTSCGYVQPGLAV
jgi:hypothetical protein